MGYSDVEEALIDAYMRCGSYTEGYKSVFDDWMLRTRTDTASVCKAAARAYTQKLRAEIGRRKKILENFEKKVAEKSAREEYDECRRIWSRADSVRSLVSIVEDCRRTRDAAMSRGEGIPTSAARLERDTIDSITRMMGYAAPQEVQQDTTITVQMGEDTEKFSV